MKGVEGRAGFYPSEYYYKRSIVAAAPYVFEWMHPKEKGHERKEMRKKVRAGIRVSVLKYEWTHPVTNICLRFHAANERMNKLQLWGENAIKKLIKQEK